MHCVKILRLLKVRNYSLPCVVGDKDDAGDEENGKGQLPGQEIQRPEPLRKASDLGPVLEEQETKVDNSTSSLWVLVEKKKTLNIFPECFAFIYTQPQCAKPFFP